MMIQEPSFVDKVLFVLEVETFRWRYWSDLLEKIDKMKDTDIKSQLGWTREQIAREYNSALIDLLFGQ